MTTPLTEPLPATDAPSQQTRKRWGQIIAWLVVIALLVLVGVKLYQVTLGPVSSGGAPDFSLTTFDGEAYTLSDYRGRVVVVNFWASWCGPCELEAADLEEVWREYKDQGVLFLGVDYVDTETEALDYLRRWDITYPNGPDLGTRISQAYRIRGVPETYIVDKEGQLAETIIGPTTKVQLTTIIERLLTEQ